VALALTALGFDASDYNGHDFTAVFNMYVPAPRRHSLNRTIHADIYALIALNTRPYDGEQDAFLQSLLRAQRADGSWSLAPADASSVLDMDVTAMALQALAPYNDDVAVDNAINSALAWLRTQTFVDVEGLSQMIVALTALGDDFADEAEYYVNQLMRWFDPTIGGFRRPTPIDPVDAMATEQAAYALVAYWRFVNGMNPLYDMSDVVEAEIPQTPADSFGLPGRHADISLLEVSYPGRTFGDIQGHANQYAVEALAARGIIGGRTADIFDPDATMTRAEFAAIMTRGLGLPTRQSDIFTDVVQSAWFADAVATAFYYQIVNGTSATTFNPRGTITRQEAAVMVARGARLTGMDTQLMDIEIMNILAMFGDSRQVAGWARSDLAFCFREGILDDAEFYIQPTAPISRAEIAEMMYRMMRQAGLV